jgi:hypothetical protein
MAQMSMTDESRQDVSAENTAGGRFSNHDRLEPLNGGYLVNLVVGTRLRLNAFHNQLDRVADCLSNDAFDGKFELGAAHQRPTPVIAAQ